MMVVGREGEERQRGRGALQQVSIQETGVGWGGSAATPMRNEMRIHYVVGEKGGGISSLHRTDFSVTLEMVDDPSKEGHHFCFVCCGQELL